MPPVMTTTAAAQGTAELVRACRGIVRRSLLAAPCQRLPVAELERRIRSFLNLHSRTDREAEFTQEISVTFFLLRFCPFVTLELRHQPRMVALHPKAAAGLTAGRERFRTWVTSQLALGTRLEAPTLLSLLLHSNDTGLLEVWADYADVGGLPAAVRDLCRVPGSQPAFPTAA